MEDNAVTSLVVPLGALKNLRIPPRAITDGSSDPEWVPVQCATRWRYGRKESVSLPLDPTSANTVRRWIEVQKRQARLLAPLAMVLSLASAMTLYVDVAHNAMRIVRLMLIMVAAGLLWWSTDSTERLTIKQHPRLITRSVLIRNVPVAVAREWVHWNESVKAGVDEPAPNRGQSRLALGVLGAALAVGVITADSANWSGVIGLVSILMLVAGVALLSNT